MKTVVIGLMAAFLGWAGKAEAGELRLYGGEKLEVFLGCVDCSDQDEESIWSKSGEYGYAPFKDTTIWNNYSKYGGTYGDYSPFNRWAKNPPALFDSHGNFLGYLTVNEKHPKRTRIRLARLMLAFNQTIRQDVPGFYELYFESDDAIESRRFSRRGGGSSWR